PDIDGAYLILTMTLRHKNMILDIYPNAADKVFTLKEYVLLDENEEDEHGNKAYEDMDVIDPFGGDYEIYKDCALEIEELLFEVIDRI
ncbi:MAG TPA: low molecular weight protein arginine phosphatase, partial [Bacillota bacterium]|nr:low molecular weight protein arginine phosphatase [Bacillota bacterium]